MTRLNEEEINSKLKELRNWSREGNYLVRRMKFKDFVSTIEFVNKIVPIAEELEHHPDLEIKDYNNLVIRLTTHDEGGITELDFELAKRIEDIFASLSKVS